MSRPPWHSNNNSSLDTFILEMTPVVEMLSKQKEEVMIVGDFNIDLLQIFTTNSVYPKITLLTRFFFVFF